MSLFASQISLAAKTAQSVMAPLTDTTGADGIFTFDSAPTTNVVGVFNEFNAADPLDPSGVRNIRLLTIFAEKSQFASAPSAAPRQTITAKGRTWTLQSTTDLPNHYRLTCRPV